MNLYFRETGKGTPVVILHGLYGCSDNWMYIARKLAETFRVIAVDLRNHGNSPHDNSHLYSDMVADVAWLFYELEIGKAHILGHSMGGKLAMAFAADYPEHVLSLTVADIAPKNYLLDTASADQYETHKTILETLSQIDLKNFTSRGDVDAELKKTIPYLFVQSFILKNLKRHGNEYEWKLNVPVLLKYLDHILSDVIASDYHDRIPMTGYPVLFIKGENSGYIHESDFPVLEKMYPGSIVITIEGTTHFLHAEKPDKFVSAFLNFLNTVH